LLHRARWKRRLLLDGGDEFGRDLRAFLLGPNESSGVAMSAIALTLGPCFRMLSQGRRVSSKSRDQFTRPKALDSIYPTG
jgi:hypothetical protein